MNLSSVRLSRRKLLGASAAAAAVTIVPRHAVAGSGSTPPSEKLNLAFIGVGGRGIKNLEGLAGQNFVAFADVDQDRAAMSLKQHPDVPVQQDFRKMLDEFDSRIDGVVISTPDHTHAVAALDAMRRGKHVYCEKPLAHCIGEVRALREAARRHRVTTQLGNQGHSAEHIRLFCEWVWDGAIGDVHTIHAGRWSDGRYTAIGNLARLQETHAVPEGLDWDLWLGPAAQRPYHPLYIPQWWRAWAPFGTGEIGDWTCHIVDPVFWALDLGSPKTVTAEVQGFDPKLHADTFPVGMHVRYEFAANGKRGPVTLNWYNGTWALPPIPEIADEKLPKNTYAIVLGTKGAIRYGSHGASGVRIMPEEKMLAYKRPEPSIPRVPDHHTDWVRAIREGRPAGSNFDYGGPLTELALLGVIASRFPGVKLEWNGEAARFANCDEANAMVNPPAREGWSFEIG
ncbi:MAG: Gfo/Idh/MocA family protein [Planctomycetota bacterium]